MFLIMFCLYLVLCLYPHQVEARCPGHIPQMYELSV